MTTNARQQEKHQMTNQELDQAIKTTHKLLNASDGDREIFGFFTLKKHLATLIDEQRKRALAKPSSLLS